MTLLIDDIKIGNGALNAEEEFGLIDYEAMVDTFMEWDIRQKQLPDDTKIL